MMNAELELIVPRRAVFERLSLLSNTKTIYWRKVYVPIPIIRNNRMVKSLSIPVVRNNRIVKDLSTHIFRNNRFGERYIDTYR